MSWRACPLRLRWCWPGLLRLRARHPRAAPALLLALFGSGCRYIWRRSCFSSCNRSLSCRPSRPTAASDGWPDLLRGVGVAVHPEQGQVSKPLVLMVSLSLAAWPSCTTGPWRSSWSASPAAAQPCPSPSSGAARRPSSSTAELWAGNSTGTGRSVRRPSAPRTAPSKAPRLQGRWRSRDIAIAVGAASFKSGPAANYYNHFKNYRKTDRAEHLDLLHCIFGMKEADISAVPIFASPARSTASRPGSSRSRSGCSTTAQTAVCASSSRTAPVDVPAMVSAPTPRRFAPAATAVRRDHRAAIHGGVPAVREEEGRRPGQENARLLQIQEQQEQQQEQAGAGQGEVERRSRWRDLPVRGRRRGEQPQPASPAQPMGSTCSRAGRSSRPSGSPSPRIGYELRGFAG